MSVPALLDFSASASIPLLSVLRFSILISHLTFVPCSKSLKVHLFFHLIIKLNYFDQTAAALLLFLHGCSGFGKHRTMRKTPTPQNKQAFITILLSPPQREHYQEAPF